MRAESLTASCIDCGAHFEREVDADWKKRCLPCWKKTKASDEPRKKPPPDLLMEWYYRGVAAGRAEAMARQESEPAPLDRARIRQLLQLCHPDKHGGSPLAESVTAWLNSIKRKAAE